MEEEASRLESRIAQCKEDKRGLMAEVVETERHVMLWERKLQLEREMQDAIDPDVGNEVVGAMRKEIHRMRLRLEELVRLQERLIGEMERGIVKREIIATKGRSAAAKKGGLESTVAGLKKQVGGGGGGLVVVGVVVVGWWGSCRGVVVRVVVLAIVVGAVLGSGHSLTLPPTLTLTSHSLRCPSSSVRSARRSVRRRRPTTASGSWSRCGRPSQRRARGSLAGAMPCGRRRRI